MAPDGAARSDFDQAWAAYPHFARRSSKATSWKRWRSLRPRPVVADVLAAIRAQALTEDWTKDGGRFVPAMEVWILKRGWDSSEGRTAIAAMNEHDAAQAAFRARIAEERRKLEAQGAAD